MKPSAAIQAGPALLLHEEILPFLHDDLRKIYDDRIVDMRTQLKTALGAPMTVPSSIDLDVMGVDDIAKMIRRLKRIRKKRGGQSSDDEATESPDEDDAAPGTR